MDNIHVVTHPLIHDALTYLRKKDTAVATFRHYSNIITQLLVAESLHDLNVTNIEIETPLVKTQGKILNDEIVVIPVLRAGIAMLDSAMRLLPDVKVGFVGMQRDEETAEASEYYWKLPELTEKTTVLITDPMLATGGSLQHLLKQITPKHVKVIKIVCVIASPEGVKRISEEYPNVQIYTASLDERLNDKKYIVPGLGDYGDRYFGT